MEVEWAKLKASELRDLAAREAIVVLPVAAMEQHGPHLPVMVDTLLCGEVAARAAKRASGRHPVVVAPTVWSGLSEHHMPFGGTFTLDFPTFKGLIECLCRSLLRHGFRRVLLLNGHGGNVASLRVVVDELRHLDLRLLTATYWQVDPVAIADLLERQSGVQHACEAETSMVMALRPELVDVSKFEAAKHVEADRIAGQTQAVHAAMRFEERTPSGAIGDPTAASAEKGEKLLEAAATAVAGVLSADKLWALPAARRG
ncbi:MAG TPA: creatininase family protein [Geminicoccaceae bacterium]|nr:creatininase family protein [Geminicoccaceae bacterium]